MHGGTVQAVSEGEGQGTTFIVRLPILVVRDVKAIPLSEVQASDEGAESFTGGIEPAISNASQLSGIRALIVEDEVDAREMLRMLLVQFGAEIKASASAQEALRILEEWKPDVLVSDVGMPDEDGYSLISQIRALEPSRGGLIPAIALTGYSRPEDGSKLLAAGYQVHLSKPVDLAQLVDTILSLASRNGEEYNASAK
jgi:CheY-like chemotaxis protein